MVDHPVGVKVETELVELAVGEAAAGVGQVARPPDPEGWPVVSDRAGIWSFNKFLVLGLFLIHTGPLSFTISLKSMQ